MQAARVVLLHHEAQGRRPPAGTPSRLRAWGLRRSGEIALGSVPGERIMRCHAEATIREGSGSQRPPWPTCVPRAARKRHPD